MKEKWMIVGLGNPGPKYKNTRHNVGFLLIDRLRVIKRSCISFELKRDKEYELFEYNEDLQRCLLVKPLTYMNLSGRAVKKLCEKYYIPPQRILIVHDDLDVPFGRMKLKYGGGLAGHKGLKSIVEYIGTRDFYRLRIGIGRPCSNENIRDYVLSLFSSSELDSLIKLLDVAIEGIFIFFEKGYDIGANFINSFKLSIPVNK